MAAVTEPHCACLACRGPAWTAGRWPCAPHVAGPAGVPGPHRPALHPVHAGILAGDASEEQAQKRVGNTLTDLRAAVGEHLHVTREWVAFDRQRPHWIDVAEFEAQVARARIRSKRRGAYGALDLYQGEFLAGVSVSDAPEFDEWLTCGSACAWCWRRRATGALKGYVQNGTAGLARLRGSRSPAGCSSWTWNEDAHQALMALLARNGQRPR